MSDTVNWSGLTFTVLPKEASWNNCAGIYIFAGRNQQNQWVPLYIGQCDSFNGRIPSHEQWDSAASLGATHVHALTVPHQAHRNTIEAALIQAFQPRLNTQLR